jgi:hypothetical protein
MTTTAQKTDPALWEKVKAEITAGDKGGKPGQWSARKAQLASHEYQQRGGGYRGAKRKDNGLQQWSDAHPGHRQLNQLGKQELLALASKQEVKGRSRMRKAQLIEALKACGL